MGPSQLRHLPDHSWAFMAPPPSHNAVLASGGHRALTLVQAESVPARALLLGWGWGLHLGAPARTPLPLPLAPSCPHLCRSHQPSLGTRTHRAMGVHHSPPPLQGQSPSGPGRGPGLTEPGVEVTQEKTTHRQPEADSCAQHPKGCACFRVSFSWLGLERAGGRARLPGDEARDRPPGPCDTPAGSFSAPDTNLGPTHDAPGSLCERIARRPGPP